MQVGKLLVTALRSGVVATALAAIVGCASSRNTQLTSSYPLDRVQAAVRAADAGDSEAVDRLVTLLEDNDSAVRMYAIRALERLCGQTYGYRYYAAELERAEAVARWRTARQRGEVTVRASSAAPSVKDASAMKKSTTGSGASQ